MEVENVDIVCPKLSEGCFDRDAQVLFVVTGPIDADPLAGAPPFG